MVGMFYRGDTVNLRSMCIPLTPTTVRTLPKSYQINLPQSQIDMIQGIETTISDNIATYSPAVRQYKESPDSFLSIPRNESTNKTLQKAPKRIHLRFKCIKIGQKEAYPLLYIYGG